MQFEIFKQSIGESQPPQGITVYLAALRYDAQGDWNKAHQLVDRLEDATACWVHGYLHRKEGDSWNADYWYHKAGKTRPGIPLDQEWHNIVQALL